MKRNARSKTEKKNKQKQGMKKRATDNLCDIIQIKFPRQMRFHSQYQRL